MTDLKAKWMPLTRGEDGKPGYEFRIYAEDHERPFPIVGAVSRHGVWALESWTAKGLAFAHTTSPNDLIPRPPTVWINVYPDGAASHHASRALAEKAAAIMVADEWRLLTCIEVPKTWED